MRVLQINAVYGVGSTGRIVADIHSELLKRGNDSYVMCATGKIEEENNHIIRIGNYVDHKLHALLRRIDYRQGWHSKRQTVIACKKIEEINPNIIHLHNLHSNYINLPELLAFISARKIPTLLTLHDCWFFTGYCMHYLKYDCKGWINECENCPIRSKRISLVARKTYQEKKRLFRDIEYLSVNGVSAWTTADASKSLLAHASIIECIYNWVDTEIFYPRESRKDFCKKYGIDHDQMIVLGVSQGWSTEKGLAEMIGICEQLGDMVIVALVGDCTEVPDLKGVLKIGYVSDKEELAGIYSSADVFVNPSRMETFGLVSAEAMACGTPVVGYDNTGIGEVVSVDCGELVEDGDESALIASVSNVLTHGKSNYSKNCIRRVKNHFDKNKQISNYMNLYQRTIQLKSDAQGKEMKGAQ